MSQDTSAIFLEGVRTHNLKGISAQFPLGKMSVVTGRSGSGKSSLVFDSLYVESYRRYVESLSSFARQYLQAMPKPEIAAVYNLPPAVAVRQSRSQANARSTVGTMTELSDFLRVVFTHLAYIWCSNCKIIVRQDQPRFIADQVIDTALAAKFAVHDELRAMILAPLDKWRAMKVEDLAYFLSTQGFTRLLLDGELTRLEETDLKRLFDAAVVIDRLSVDESHRHRLQDGFTLAFQIGKGKAALVHEKLGKLLFSNDYSCPYCSRVYKPPSLALFNHNNPLGACHSCQGFGRVSTLDWNKIIPDRSASMASKGIAPYNSGKFAEFYEWAKAGAKIRKIKWDKPFSGYTESEWEWLVKGAAKEGYPGIEGLFSYLDSKKYKAHYRIMAARYRSYELCPSCQGQRLNEAALSCHIEGQSIAAIHKLSISELNAWLDRLTPSASVSEMGAAEVQGQQEAIAEMRSRLSYLLQIGLSYLTLDRLTQTLSGGEAQRINMARSLGSAMTETLFCLDEPTCGLHPRDTGNLLQVMRFLQAQGNTLVVVEHEKLLIEAADHLIKLGPESGHEGGSVAYAGSPTFAAVEEKLSWPIPREILDTTPMLRLQDVNIHNLKNVTVEFPAGHMTVVCGVSGSGKTSLIEHSLFPLLSKALGKYSGELSVLCGSVGPERMIRQHAEVVMVSQENLNRSSRSNVMTYLDFYDLIRRRFAGQELAKKRKYTPGTFSFNVPGGRCENCKGLGTVEEDLSFLGEMEVVCQVCQGQRFQAEVLEIRYKGRNLFDVMQLTVGEAAAFFHEEKELARVLTAVCKVGLGYLRLGQHTSSFSGGEAQRLKLLWLLKETELAKPALLIFDEPMTGLSDYDVSVLLQQLKDLTLKGHTVVVIEHHIPTIRAADWLVELGPESGEAGGNLVYQGQVLGIKAVATSPTAPFIL